MSLLERTEVMKVVAMNGFGSTDTFTLEKRKIPNPNAGEIRIQIKSVGFNPVDWKIRKNWYEGDSKQVMGCECSGIVDAIGHGTEGFCVGDEVSALTFRSSNGSYAQYSCVPQELVIKKPKNLSFEEASIVPLAAMTAYRATLSVSAVKKGDIVFVAGAGGGVGSFAIQLLKLAEVAKIYTIAKDEESAQFLIENIGINKDHILIYEELSKQELKEKILAMNNGLFFHATFDFVGGEIKNLCLELTGLSGHFSTVVPEVKFDFPFWEENAIPRARNLSVHQVAIGAELGSKEKDSLQIYKNHLKIIMDLLEEGKLKLPVITVVGLLSKKTVQEAHKLMESGRVKGKLVMLVQE